MDNIAYQQPSLDELTEKECEVVELVLRGFSNRAIADRLRLSIQTIKSRLTCIHQKLNLQSRTQVAVYALTGYRPCEQNIGVDAAAKGE